MGKFCDKSSQNPKALHFILLIFVEICVFLLNENEDGKSSQIAFPIYGK